MPEVNFARERERAGDWPELQFVVRSRIPAGREGVGPMAVSWPVVKHGGETLECVFIWRNMPCTMPVIAHVLLWDWLMIWTQAREAKVQWSVVLLSWIWSILCEINKQSCLDFHCSVSTELSDRAINPGPGYDQILSQLSFKSLLQTAHTRVKAEAGLLLISFCQRISSQKADGRMTSDACLCLPRSPVQCAWLHPWLPQHNPLTTDTNWSRTQQATTYIFVNIPLQRLKYI